MDLHTNRFNICETVEGSDERIRDQFMINQQDMQRFTNSLNQSTYVMVESCANSFKFAELIYPHVAEVIVADSHKLKIISQSNKKTDKVDAENAGY